MKNAIVEEAFELQSSRDFEKRSKEMYWDQSGEFVNIGSWRIETPLQDWFSTFTRNYSRFTGKRKQHSGGNKSDPEEEGAKIFQA